MKKSQNGEIVHRIEGEKIRLYTYQRVELY